MTNFLDLFISAWHYIQICSFGFTCICFIYQMGIFMGWSPMISVKKLVILWLCILQFIPILIIGAEASRQIENIAMAELNDYLLNSEELTITINGQIIEENDTIISVFKKPDYNRSYHNSNPTDSILISFHKRDDIFKVLLRQDSQLPNEYWMYLPKYGTTSKNEVGKINAEIFTKYVE